MKARPYLACVFACLLPLIASADIDPRPAEPERGGFWWDLVPRAFSRRPAVRVTVRTELTDEGKKRPEPDAGQPIRYAAHAVGYRHVGNAPAQRQPPSPAVVRQVLTSALARSGFVLVEQPDEPVEIVVVYHWGAHTNLTPEVAAPSDVMLNFAARARLIGGDEYAERLVKAWLQRIEQWEVASLMTPRHAASGSTPLTGLQLQSIGFHVFDPVRQLTGNDFTQEYIVGMAEGDIYFVVASAYDAGSVARGERILLWRTTIAVETNSVSLRETLPVMADAAVPYFGREQTEVTLIKRRVDRQGTVDVGESTVVGYLPPPKWNGQEATPASPEEPR